MKRQNLPNSSKILGTMDSQTSKHPQNSQHQERACELPLISSNELWRLVFRPLPPKAGRWVDFVAPCLFPTKRTYPPRPPPASLHPRLREPQIPTLNPNSHPRIPYANPAIRHREREERETGQRTNKRKTKRKKGKETVVLTTLPPDQPPSQNHNAAPCSCSSARQSVILGGLCSAKLPRSAMPCGKRAIVSSCGCLCLSHFYSQPFRFLGKGEGVGEGEDTSRQLGIP